jgi:hypothetical protein
MMHLRRNIALKIVQSPGVNHHSHFRTTLFQGTEAPKSGADFLPTALDYALTLTFDLSLALPRAGAMRSATC